MEVYKEKPIIYGCGDFINDYEGIGGYERYRAELTLMYFVKMDAQNRRLTSLHMTPMRMRRFRVNRATAEETQWLKKVLDREGTTFGTQVALGEDNTLALRWTPIQKS